MESQVIPTEAPLVGTIEVAGARRDHCDTVDLVVGMRVVRIALQDKGLKLYEREVLQN
jgi:hypothetical protein